MKYCTKCGAELRDEARFCPKCGSSTGETVTQPRPASPPNSGEIKPGIQMTGVDPRIVADVKLSKIVAVGVLVFGLIPSLLTFFTWVEMGDIFERKNFMYYTLVELFEPKYMENSGLQRAMGFSLIGFFLFLIFSVFTVIALVGNRKFYLRIFLSGGLLLISACTGLFAIVDKSELPYGCNLTSVPFIFLGCSIIYFLSSVVVVDIGYRHIWNVK